MPQRLWIFEASSGSLMGDLKRSLPSAHLLFSPDPSLWIITLATHLYCWRGYKESDVSDNKAKTHSSLA